MHISRIGRGGRRGVYVLEIVQDYHYCYDLLSVAFIPVLTSSTILDLVKGISHDDAKKVAIRLGVQCNYINNTSRSADPELHAHELIEEWLKNFDGTEKEAIMHLSTAFRKSRLGSYAARLLPRNYPHAGCPSTHLPILQPPIEMSLVQASQLLGLPYSSLEFPRPSSPKQLLQTSLCSATVLLSPSQALLPRVLPNSSSVPQVPIPSSQVQLPQTLPCSTRVQSSQAHVKLLGTLRLVRAAIINLKDRKGSPLKDIIGHILTNCGACKDIQIKRALVKGVARGMVTYHLHPDGCTGFKLANLECCYTCLQRDHPHVYIRQSHPKCHHASLHFKCHYTSLRRGHLKYHHKSLRRGHLKYHHKSLQRGHLKYHHKIFRRNHFNHHHKSLRGSHFNHQHSRPYRNRFRHHNTGKLSNRTKEQIITISPSSVHSGDITTPIPTHIDETTVPEHLKAKSPHKAADTTTPLIPFPTPSKEDDVAPPKDTIHRILPQPETSQEAKVHEDILKVFFITIIGTRDSSTIASVGRALLGDCKYERLVNREQQEHTKRVINQVFEEWKQQCKGDLDFRKLCDIFGEIGCKDLVKRTELFIRKQIRLFSFDESI